MQKLTLESLLEQARIFSAAISNQPEKSLFGVTDGKAVGTFLEHKFRDHLKKDYEFTAGSSASGIDFPELLVDLKVTSIDQPQSSCPFKSARQKVFGLGYSLLIFVYEKSDDPTEQTSLLNILHTLFVEARRTADFQITKGLLQILENEGNREDIVAFLEDRNLPADPIELYKIADEILEHPPEQGFLTISNALQWRLQYSRVIQKAGQVDGVVKVYG